MRLPGTELVAEPFILPARRAVRAGLRSGNLGGDFARSKAFGQGRVAAQQSAGQGKCASDFSRLCDESDDVHSRCP